MAVPVPNWLRIILIILSLISFLPQIYEILRKRSSKDVSPVYILINLISATEQLILGPIYIIVFQEADFLFPGPENRHLGVGDWLNLAQLMIVFIYSLALFMICLFYAPITCRKGRLVAIYILFLVASLTLFYFFVMSFFRWIHYTIVAPAVSIAVLASLCFQWKKASALSTLGLAMQTVVFTAVAISWLTRVPLLELPEEYQGVSLSIWCSTIGWVVIENGLLALVQAVLLCLSLRAQRKENIGDGEIFLA